MISEDTKKPDEKDEEDLDTIEAILGDIVKAQASLGGERASAKNLDSHVRDTLYPLLSRSLVIVGDLVTTFESLADEMSKQDEFIEPETQKYLIDYVDLVNQYIAAHAQEAQAAAASGNDQHWKELQGLYEVGKTVKGVLMGLGGEE